ncbi:MAG: hypothetical protein RLZZ164_1192 [Actinomycetota bacterium]|jgi:pilus assembly protein CpaF
MLDFAGLDPNPELMALGRLLAEPGVTDLVCNGFRHVQLLRGGVWFGAPSPFSSPEQLDLAARALVAAAGRRVDLSAPAVSATLGERIRVHAVLASGIATQTLLSIRVLADRKFGLGALAQIGMLDEQTRSRLSVAMKAGRSILVSGASGSGKTTMLRALLSEVSDKRVVVIEDTAELRMSEPNFASLVSRPANIEGKGAIELNDLVVESLRMRADRIVIGEVRSAELLALLQAGASGHAIATTIHVRSPSDVIARINSIALAQGHSLDAVRELVKVSVDLIVHIDVRDGRRSALILETNNA